MRTWARRGVPTGPVTDGPPRIPGEWSALSGELVDAPAGATTTVYDVPIEVLGRAVDSGFQRPMARDGDTAPRPDLPLGGAGEQSFGPSDDVDGLLRADQVPALRNLPAPRVRPRPLDATQVFPILSDGLPSTVDAPVERVSGELPVASSLPGRSDGPITEVLPRLGGPGLPPSPAAHRVAPPTDSRPGGQDVPAASAAQLMAQLRGLINELESGDSGRLRPLDVTSFQEPEL